MSKGEIETLQERILHQKSDLDTALKEEGTTRDELLLDEFPSLKRVMKNNGVTMTDSSRFVGAVVGAKNLGFDPGLIVEKVSNVMKLEIDQKGLEERVKSLNENVQALQLNWSKLEQEELSHSYSISIYRELEKMGMGIKQLKRLLNTVRDCYCEFFSDVQI